MVIIIYHPELQQSAQVLHEWMDQAILLTMALPLPTNNTDTVTVPLNQQVSYKIRKLVELTVQVWTKMYTDDELLSNEELPNELLSDEELANELLEVNDDNNTHGEHLSEAMLNALTDEDNIHDDQLFEWALQS